MQRGDEAGLSARERSEQLRAKARKLDEAADRYQQGAAGEEATARLLARLDATRFRVFHDIRLPGSRANVDHVVVGPTGLFVVDSKNYTARVNVNKGTLWCGRYPQTRRLETAHWEAGQVVEALRLDSDDVPVPTVILCIHGVELPFESAEVGDALVVAPSFLLGSITRRPARLTPAQCARLKASVEHRLYGVAVPTTVPAPAPAVRAPGLLVIAPTEPTSWWTRLHQRVRVAR